LFSTAEKEALNFANSLTRLNGNKKISDKKLLKILQRKRSVDIGICVSIMNVFNKLGISIE
jgi:hypothetical protein